MFFRRENNICIKINLNTFSNNNATSFLKAIQKNEMVIYNYILIYFVIVKISIKPYTKFDKIVLAFS
jgi:hypothetical protein